MFFIICINYANANTYYVKATGGNGSGLTDADAWSFSKLSSTSLNPGDFVFFNRGDTFYGQISSTNANSNGVTFGAYGTGVNPLISGFTQVNSWTQFNGNIYYTTLNVASLNAVTLDGSIIGMGRYPKTGYLTYISHTNNSSITGSVSIPFNPTGGQVVIRKYRWIIDRHKIASVNGNTINYTTDNNYGNNNIYSPVDNNGFFIQGCLGTLTQNGDWYYDNSSGRLYMYFSDLPGNHVVKASTQTQNLYVNYFTTLTFNNIDFEGGNLYGAYIVGTSNITFNNCNFRQQGGDAININNSQNIIFNFINISDALNNGIYEATGGNSTLVTNSATTNIGIIAGAGKSGDGAQQAIAITGDGTTISNCVIKNTGYNGINFAGNNVLIEKNLIDTFCTLKDDGGGIYTYNGTASAPTTNRIVRNNIILNAIGALAGAGAYYWENFGKAAGIYLDDYSNGTQVYNNGIANGGWLGIFLHNGYNNQILNNQVFNFGVAQIELGEDFLGAIRSNLITGNNFISKTTSESTLEAAMTVNESPRLFGSLNNNEYGRPFDDSLTFDVYQNYTGGTGINNVTLATWQLNYKLDLNSRKSPIIYPSYYVGSVNGLNKDLNSNFDSNISGVSLTGSGSLSYVPNSKLSGGALQVANSGTTYVIIPVGALDPTKQYDLKFTALSSQTANLKVYLRQGSSPYTLLSTVSTEKITTSVAQYECLFSFPTVQANSSLIFESDSQNLNYWLDNIQFYDANVTAIKPDDFMFFYYNASTAPESISLSDNYIDPQNVSYSGAVVLQPFTSIILMKQYCVQPPKPLIQSTTP